MSDMPVKKKSIFSNPLFWISGCLILFFAFLVIAVAAFFIIRSVSSSSNYQSELTKVWEKTLDDSERIVDKSNTVSDKNSLTAFTADVNDFAESVNEQKKDIEDLEAAQKYDKAQEDMIESYEKLENYLDDFYDVLNQDPGQLNSDSFFAVNESADEAEESFEKSLNNFDFLDSLPSLLFKMHIRLSPVYEDIWAKRDSVKKQADQKKANERKKQKQQANLKKAEQVVNSFCSYWISSKVTQMRGLLAGEALSEFNPDIEFQGDFERVGYSVVSKEITDKGNYRFYVYIQSQDFEQIQFTDEYKIVVGMVDSDLKIIRRKYVKRVE